MTPIFVCWVCGKSFRIFGALSTQGPVVFTCDFESYLNPNVLNKKDLLSIRSSSVSMKLILKLILLSTLLTKSENWGISLVDNSLTSILKSRSISSYSYGTPQIKKYFTKFKMNIQNNLIEKLLFKASL